MLVKCNLHEVNAVKQTQLLNMLTVVVVTACGSDSKEELSTTEYGTLTVSDSTTSNDNGSFSLTTLTKCSRNADTGRVDVTIGLSTGQSLSIAIKNYSSSPKKYSCVQASDNKESTSDVGGKFDDCMVEARTLSASGATTVNGYSMHRDAATTKPFSYTGECSIDVTAASPSIQATIACSSMIQTVLESAPRNPINADVKANVAGTIDCRFQ